MKKAQAAMAWCPFPDAEAARTIAARLLEAKLIACANILPHVESVFEWQSEVSSASECAVVFKTTADCLDDLVTRLGELHPYETPAILGWRCDVAHPLTLHWLAGQCITGNSSAG